MKEIQIGTKRGFLDFTKYGNGRICIQFVERNGNLIDTLTVNLPDEECKEDEVFININCSFKNEIDLVLELSKIEVLNETIEFVGSGFLIYPKCKLYKYEK